jgi:hypothetical protein
MELLPCPFCGCKPVKRDRFNIGCEVCNFELNNLPHLIDEQWNTRTPIVQQSLSGAEQSSFPKSCPDCGEDFLPPTDIGCANCGCVVYK